MIKLTRYQLNILLFMTSVVLFVPLLVTATTPTFDNPLSGTLNVNTIILRLITWLIGISAFVALLALVFGGFRLIIGGFGNEQEAAAAKKIITWAVIGLTVVGLAAVILGTITFILGV